MPGVATSPTAAIRLSFAAAISATEPPSLCPIDGDALRIDVLAVASILTAARTSSA